MRAIPRLNASPSRPTAAPATAPASASGNANSNALAGETGLVVTVAHLPPGTSKWNRIEHRLFAYISQNWRGKPLVSHQVIIQLIGATTTNTGLTVTCDIDQSLYPKGIKVTDAEMATLNIQRHTFQGDWNYTISPRQQGPP
jgi:Rhodopirellula transposase DDE domain